MSDQAAQLERALAIFAKSGPVLRTSDALALGIRPKTLYLLRDEGHIIVLDRGLYRLTTAEPSDHADLIAVTVRAPRAVICLLSALTHHGLTRRTPSAVDIALPSHAQIPKIANVAVRPFWFSEPSFSSGVDSVRLDNTTARVYSPEKTIADCFKYRNKLGLDVAVEALRLYKERSIRPEKHKLEEFARVDRVLKFMSPYIEAII